MFFFTNLDIDLRNYSLCWLRISNLITIIFVYLLIPIKTIVRTIKKNGPLSVQAIAETHVVLLGINMEETEKNGVLGFGIQRRDLDSDEEPVWLFG